MKRRMSVEEEWKARLAKRKGREAASRAKGSAGLPPTKFGGGGGSIANRSPGRRTTGKHHAH